MLKVLNFRYTYVGLSIVAIICLGLIVVACGEDNSPTAPQAAAASGSEEATTGADGGGKNDDNDKDKGKKNKIFICHVTGNGSYHLLEVSANAEPAHREHGDAGIGEEVPTVAGKVFNDECVPSVISIELEKATNGRNADDAPGPGILVGEDVDWTYEVTNTGEVPVINVAVTDDQGVAVTCPDTELASGASTTCNASGTAVVDQYANLGTAEATSVADFPVSDDDPSHYFGEDPSIDIEKATNGEDADTPPGPTVFVGDPIEWTYEVTNTGNVELEDVAVTDDQGVTVSCLLDTLQPGESMTCTASGTAVPGEYQNIGTATGNPPHGPDVTDSDASHYTSTSSAIDIEKFTNGANADQAPGPAFPVGGSVDWTYVVTNTGDTVLTAVSVSDNQGVQIRCPASTLAPGATMTCLGSGTVIEGQYSNIGTAMATTPEGDTVSDADPSHYFGEADPVSEIPVIDIEKATNGLDADVAPGPQLEVGDAVNWTYRVANTGNADFINVSVVDDQGVAVSCPQSSLVQGESMICTGSGSAVVGQYRNVGTATGETADGITVMNADPSHYNAGDAFVSIEKATNGNDADSPPGPTIAVGNPITWTYVVSNDGEVPLAQVFVTDDSGVSVVCPMSTLEVGQSMTCTAQGTASAGQYRNIGTVNAVSPGGRNVIDSDPSHYIGQIAQPAIKIEKSTNGQDADSAPGPTIAAGEGIAWTYLVTNIGDAALVNVSVADDQGVAVICPPEFLVPGVPGYSLDPGQSMVCTGNGVATLGAYKNIGTATGMTAVSGGVTVSATDPSHYLGKTNQQNPGIDIEKATNGFDADQGAGPTITPGTLVTWTYVVSNTGDVVLGNVRVVDDRLGNISCPKSVLNPGESMTCMASGTAITGQYSNMGTALGEPPSGRTVQDRDPSHYFGGLENEPEPDPSESS